MSGLSTKQKRRERERERVKAHYHARRQAGMCVSCPSLALPGRKRCAACNHAERTRVATRVAKKGTHESTLWRRNNRRAVIAAYGGQCSVCAEYRLPFLTIDHIAGGGNQHRKQVGVGASFYKWLVRNNCPAGYQVLCWNHNWLKAVADLLKTPAHRRDTPLSRYRARKRAADRGAILAAYGGKCQCCGTSDDHLLTIDHVTGGGGKERKQFRNTAEYYASFKRRGFPPGYQVLCWNCNCGRQVNGGVCPHKDIVPSED